MDRSPSRSHHLAKFGVNWSGASRVITYLICHKNTWLKDYMRLWDGAPPPPCQVYWRYALWSWRCNGFSLSRDLARPRDQRVCDIMGRSPSRQVTILPSLLPSFICKWFESTWHTMLISLILVIHALTSNRRKIHKQLLQVRLKNWREQWRNWFKNWTGVLSRFLGIYIGVNWEKISMTAILHF